MKDKIKKLTKNKKRLLLIILVVILIICLIFIKSIIWKLLSYKIPYIIFICEFLIRYKKILKIYV